MQWSAKRNGGFSTAPKKSLAQPMIEDKRYGFRQINVEAQQGDPDSLLSYIKELTQLRRANKAIGTGSCTVVDSGSKHVLAHRYKSDHSPLLFLHNLKGGAVSAGVELGPGMENLKCVFGGDDVIVKDGRLTVKLEPYGVRWLGRP